MNIHMHMFQQPDIKDEYEVDFFLNFKYEFARAHMVRKKLKKLYE